MVTVCKSATSYRFAGLSLNGSTLSKPLGVSKYVGSGRLAVGARRLSDHVGSHSKNDPRIQELGKLWKDDFASIRAKYG
jgi:hypothetical protein